MFGIEFPVVEANGNRNTVKVEERRKIHSL
jgi:hypothetical protein